VFGDERDRHHQNGGLVLGGALDLAVRAGVYPFLWRRSGLVTDGVVDSFAPGGRYGGNGFLYLPLIGVAGSDDRLGQAVGGEQYPQRDGWVQLGAGAVVSGLDQCGCRGGEGEIGWVAA
jgi:hypothetical protein